MRIINLLPKAKQQELKYEAHLHSLVVVIWISIFSFVAVIAIQFGAKFFLQNELETLESRIIALQQQTTKEENTVIKNKVRDINNIVTDYKALADAAPKWSKIIRAFAPLAPDNVRVNSFVVDVTKKQAVITGFSQTRDDVIKLYENIKADDKNFYNVNYPLEHVAKSTNVNFSFNFTVRDELFK
jgi:hypothetical protein